MIVILCDSFQDAKAAFDLFLSFLQSSDPWTIRTIYASSYCVETDEDLRYIFIDRRMKPLFEGMRPDVLEEQEFFDEVPGFYDELYWREEYAG